MVIFNKFTIFWDCCGNAVKIYLIEAQGREFALKIEFRKMKMKDTSTLEVQEIEIRQDEVSQLRKKREKVEGKGIDLSGVEIIEKVEVRGKREKIYIIQS